MLACRASNRSSRILLLSYARTLFTVLFVLSISFLNTYVVFSKPDQSPALQVSEIVIVPRNYVFTWGSSGQNIDANNTVYCSSNSDFWQVLYWRTSDTNSSAGVNDWNPNIVTAGNYDIYVYLPDYTHAAPITQQARYYFNGSLLATLDQNLNKCQWVWIGRQWFDAGTGSTISMPAQTSENPYRLIAGDGLKLVYVPPNYSASGFVTDTGGNPIPGVRLTLNTGATTTSAANGSYQFNNLAGGNYTITPSMSGLTFSPASSSFTLSGNLPNINFTVTNRYYITGRTQDTNGNAVPNVTLTLYGLSTQMTTTSAADGRYAFSNLVPGLYQVQPDRSTFPFSPAARGWMFVPPVATGQDFTTTPVYGGVAGKVTVSGAGSAVSGARVSIAGKTVQTDGSGNYTLSGILPGTHAVYITATGYKDYQGSVSVQANVTSTHNASIQYILPVGYRLPFPAGVSRKLINIGHSTGYAQDWQMPVGSDIVAARGGKVLYVAEGSDIGGPSVECKYGNYIAVKHDDTTITWYVHLKKDGALFKQGDEVKSGQVIAKSGYTGCTSTPHLHFAWTKSDGKTRMTPNFLDVPGGVPTKGNWYVSGNVFTGSPQATSPGIQAAADAVAPVGSIRFQVAGASTDRVVLNAFDYDSATLEVRLATSETELQTAGWQPLESSVSWNSPVVYGQFKDESGNISPVYSDVIEAIAYETLLPGFSVAAQVCAGQEVIISNESAPLCEQCGWSWTMGNVTSFSSMNPVWTDPGDGFFFPEEGQYTVTLQASNAITTTSVAHDVTVLEAPSGAFTISRLADTIWVAAQDLGVAGYAWEFGDGTTAIGRAATHTYANTETLEASLVKLTVTGTNGCSTTTYQQAPPPRHVYIPIIWR